MAESTAPIESIQGVEGLDRLLSEPTPEVIDTLSRLEGDLLVLGVAGKMGPSLAWMARRAFDAAGRRDRRVIGVARFSEPGREAWLRERGIETIACDLLDLDALERLPDVPNVVSMFAMKFGSTGQEGRTWAMNGFLPGLVARQFRRSRIVVFSSGNIYGLTPVAGGGSKETDLLRPVGEYAMTCVGRERILEHLSGTLAIPMALIRLNYATEMRYGVLVDIGRQVLEGRPVDLAMGYVNVIWQGDANAHALRSFDHVASPARILNVTGPEILSVRAVAERFGQRLGKPVSFLGVEGDDALLNNAGLSHRLFGPPRLDADRLIDLTVRWLLGGGSLLDKPTHFEARHGRF